MFVTMKWEKENMTTTDEKLDAREYDQCRQVWLNSTEWDHDRFDKWIKTALGKKTLQQLGNVQLSRVRRVFLAGANWEKKLDAREYDQCRQVWLNSTEWRKVQDEANVRDVPPSCVIKKLIHAADWNRQSTIEKPEDLNLNAAIHEMQPTKGDGCEEENKREEEET